MAKKPRQDEGVTMEHDDTIQGVIDAAEEVGIPVVVLDDQAAADDPYGEMQLPPPPPADGHGDDDQIPFGAKFSGAIDESLWESLPDTDTAVPNGVYDARLKAWTKSISSSGNNVYKLTWTLQEEPYTGRVAYDNRMTWGSEEDFAAALDPQSPIHKEARLRLQKNMFWARKFVKGIGVKLSTFGNSLDNLLNTKPECKLRLRVKERQEKITHPDGTVEYKGTGKMTDNDIVEYLPKQR